MPRAKRQKTGGVEAATQQAESAIPHFLRLPVELFDMILEYYPEPPEDSVILTNAIGVDAKYGERGQLLRALSGTCRALRNKCLPLAWEHIEACVIYPEKGTWYKQVSKRLQSVSEVLCNCPHLTQHVRYGNIRSYGYEGKTDIFLISVATVTLTRCSTDTVLPAFAECLGVLPNLHTLRIIHAHSQMTTALKNSFEGKQYPQIRKIILPSCAHNILRACPQAREVICNEDDGSKLITAIASACKNVESLHYVHGGAGTLKRKLS